jgi:hypothetical protein
MKNDTFCDQVKESLVDLCEGLLSPEETKTMKEHIATCESCSQEFALVEKILKNVEKVAPDEIYFDQLTEKINEKIMGPCERAQSYIVNIYSDEIIPADILQHLEECTECKKEIAFVENMFEQMHKLSVPMPNEKYFQYQLNKIDNIIDKLPSKRIIRVESKEVTGFFAGLFDTMRSTLLQPYAAIAVSAMVVLLIVGAKFYSSKESIEEKQINLSEVINNKRSVAESINGNDFSVHQAKNITSPIEDERLQINTTGSAKEESKKDKNKKVD